VKPRVLIVEDDADAREVLQFALEVEGQPVLVAADGREGLEVAAAARPDVVFVDLRLPDLDGFEVGRRLRLLLGQEVRIIALTGFDRDEDRAATVAAGFDGHLAKPVGADTILALLAA
jgi:CheY-like chemotaxis protein